MCTRTIKVKHGGSNILYQSEVDENMRSPIVFCSLKVIANHFNKMYKIQTLENYISCTISSSLLKNRGIKKKS